MDQQSDLVREITQFFVHLKAIIQDIDNFDGDLVELQQLNELGRGKIAILRKKLNQLDVLSKDADDDDFVADVVIQQKEFTTIVREFRDANLNAMTRQERNERESLMKKQVNEPDTVSGADTITSHKYAIKMNRKITDKLLTINSTLEQATKQSYASLDRLAVSSQKVHNTNEELLFTSDSIKQSAKLLEKVGQRAITDKILLVVFVGFFVACVLYVVQSRLF